MWHNVVQVATSYPIGVLADRYGALGVLVFGYVLGALTAVLTALAFALNAGTVPVLTAIFFIAGLYVAVQEALESTVTASMASAEMLATSYGVRGTVNGTAKFVSSTAVGVLWTVVSPVFSFGITAFLMAAGTVRLIQIRGNGRTD